MSVKISSFFFLMVVSVSIDFQFQLLQIKGNWNRVKKRDILMGDVSNFSFQ